MQKINNYLPWIKHEFFPFTYLARWLDYAWNAQNKHFSCKMRLTLWNEVESIRHLQTAKQKATKLISKTLLFQNKKNQSTESKFFLYCEFGNFRFVCQQQMPLDSITVYSMTHMKLCKYFARHFLLVKYYHTHVRRVPESIDWSIDSCTDQSNHSWQLLIAAHFILH